jgi:hypothetical protein
MLSKEFSPSSNNSERMSRSTSTSRFPALTGQSKPFTVKDPVPRGSLKLVSSQMLPLPEKKGMPAFVTFSEKWALVWSESKLPDPTIAALPGTSMASGFNPVTLVCVELDPQSL